jgi:PAS domain S-box-containing protein
MVRLSFESLALGGCGLFVAELVLNRRLTLKGRERLKVLVETSPAATVTVDDHGIIELANQAAIEMMAPRDGKLAGTPIAAFLPELHRALRWEEAPQFRATMQCRGHRADGETFTAEVWFSTYKEGAEPKLAAIQRTRQRIQLVSQSQLPQVPGHGPRQVARRGGVILALRFCRGTQPEPVLAQVSTVMLRDVALGDGDVPQDR